MKLNQMIEELIKEFGVENVQVNFCREGVQQEVSELDRRAKEWATNEEIVIPLSYWVPFAMTMSLSKDQAFYDEIFNYEVKEAYYFDTLNGNVCESRVPVEGCIFSNYKLERV